MCRYQNTRQTVHDSLLLANCFFNSQHLKYVQVCDLQVCKSMSAVTFELLKRYLWLIFRTWSRQTQESNGHKDKGMTFMQVIGNYFQLTISLFQEVLQHCSLDLSMFLLYFNLLCVFWTFILPQDCIFSWWICGI